MLLRGHEAHPLPCRQPLPPAGFSKELNIRHDRRLGLKVQVCETFTHPKQGFLIKSFVDF